MGASGTGPFENDFALDLCDEIRAMEPDQALGALRSALAAAVDTPSGEYLERNVGEPAVAAAGIAIARRKGETALLDELGLDSIIPPIPDDVLPLIILAIERVAQPDSEVRRLWEQVGADDEWLRIIRSLADDARSGRG